MGIARMVRSERSIKPLDGLSEEIDAVWEILSVESDLAVALAGTAYLEQCLGSLISRSLKTGSTATALLDPDGLIGSFSARARLAYVLRLISKPLYLDLRVIGEIRNKFAHSYRRRTFDDPDIKRLCTSLSYFKQLGKGETPLGTVGNPSTPRKRFVISTFLMFSRLLAPAKPSYPSTAGR